MAQILNSSSEFQCQNYVLVYFLILELHHTSVCCYYLVIPVAVCVTPQCGNGKLLVP